MSITTKIKAVDFDKLSTELRKRGLNMRQASIRMGRCETYLSGMKRAERLSDQSILMLDVMWNIKYKDIAPTKKEEPAMEKVSESAPKNALTISGEELRHIITEAVKDAFTWYANM